MPVSKLFADGLKYLTDESLPIGERFAKFNAPLHEYVGPEVITRDVNFRSNDRWTKGRWYRSPKATGPQPLLIWFHGGGYEMGDYNIIEGHVFSLELADRGHINVFNYDYTKIAPGSGLAFPLPLEDGYNALQYVLKNLNPAEVDVNRIFVGGISAGGALAAVVATLDRNSGNPKLAGQLLNCPVLHRVIPEPSQDLAEDISQWPWIIDNKEITGLHQRLGSNPAGSPDWWWAGDVKDFKGLPATQIINCQYDGLRASGEKYAADLAAAGTDVEVSYQPGVPHAHINRIPEDCPEVVETMNSMLEWIARH